MQALPSIPTVAPPPPEHESVETPAESQPESEPGTEAEATLPIISPFELDTSNIIPVNLAGPGPRKQPRKQRQQPRSGRDDVRRTAT